MQCFYCLDDHDLSGSTFTWALDVERTVLVQRVECILNMTFGPKDDLTGAFKLLEHRGQHCESVRGALALAFVIDKGLQTALKLFITHIFSKSVLKV